MFHTVFTAHKATFVISLSLSAVGDNNPEGLDVPHYIYCPQSYICNKSFSFQQWEIRIQKGETFHTVFTSHRETFAISLSFLQWEIRIQKVDMFHTIFTAHKSTFVISLSLFSSGR